MKKRWLTGITILILTASTGLQTFTTIASEDSDGDGVPDVRDNCPSIPNPEKIAFRAATSSGLGDIYIMNADGTGVTQLTHTVPDDREVSISPNGSKILFRGIVGGINSEILLMDLDGSNLVNLSNNLAESEFYPTFSPDGRKIAFTVTRDGSNDIYIMDVETSVQTRITNQSASYSHLSFSPDGSKIVFSIIPGGGNRDIYSINIDGTGLTLLADLTENALHPVFNPQGTKIIFDTLTGLGSSEIFQMDANGGNLVNLTNNPAPDTDARFSPDGSQIVFASGRALTTFSEIYRMNADGSDVTRLTFLSAVELDSFQPFWGKQADSDGDGIGDACEAPSYEFSGFFPPVANEPTINQVKAGSSVPVKFSLNGDQGLDIFTAGSPSSRPISCDTGGGTSQVDETISAGGSGLTYDATAEQYVYVWKTNKAWSGQCRRLDVSFKDGQLFSATFSLE